MTRATPYYFYSIYGEGRQIAAIKYLRRCDGLGLIPCDIWRATPNDMDIGAALVALVANPDMDLIVCSPDPGKGLPAANGLPLPKTSLLADIARDEGLPHVVIADRFDLAAGLALMARLKRMGFLVENAFTAARQINAEARRSIADDKPPSARLMAYLQGAIFGHNLRKPQWVQTQLDAARLGL